MNLPITQTVELWYSNYTLILKLIYVLCGHAAPVVGLDRQTVEIPLILSIPSHHIEHLRKLSLFI